MRGSRKFFQRGSNFDYIFLVDEGREGPNTTILWAINGPPAKRHLFFVLFSPNIFNIYSCTQTCNEIS